jgi:hypothetical protein
LENAGSRKPVNVLVGQPVNVIASSAVGAGRSVTVISIFEQPILLRRAVIDGTL